MQTERVTFLASPKEKARLFSRARALGVSSSEVIRRALDRDDDDMDGGEELAVLVAEANAALPKIAASLERITGRLEAMTKKNEAFLERMGIAR